VEEGKSDSVNASEKKPEPKLTATLTGSSRTEREGGKITKTLVEEIAMTKIPDDGWYQEQKRNPKCWGGGDER